MATFPTFSGDLMAEGEEGRASLAHLLQEISQVSDGRAWLQQGTSHAILEH
jgi:hypothetical protein